jgi:hypothetical protein
MPAGANGRLRNPRKFVPDGFRPSKLVQISELRPPEGRHKAKPLISGKFCPEKTDLEGRRKAKPHNFSKLMGKKWPPKGQKKAKLNNLRKSRARNQPLESLPLGADGAQLDWAGF